MDIVSKKSIEAYSKTLGKLPLLNARTAIASLIYMLIGAVIAHVKQMASKKAESTPAEETSIEKTKKDNESAIKDLREKRNAVREQIHQILEDYNERITEGSGIIKETSNDINQMREQLKKNEEAIENQNAEWFERRGRIGDARAMLNITADRQEQ